MRNIKSLNEFVNESTGIKIGDTVEKKFASDEKDYTRKFKVLSVDKSGKAELAEIGNNVKGKVTNIYVSDLVRLNEREVNEGSFYRLPKDIIADELYLASKDLMNFYQNTSAGRDIDTSTLDNVIKNLEKVKKAVKKFNTKEDVIGTVYEGEVLLYDEIGTELEALKKKIKDLMRTATNNKWVSALGTALTALSNLDRNLSQHDAKLGSIVTEGEVNLFDEVGPELEALRNKVSLLMRKSTDSKWTSALGKALSAISTLDRNLSQADAKLGVVLIESEMNEASSTLTMKETQMAGEISQVINSYKNLKKAEKINVLNNLILRVESGELSESEMNEAYLDVNDGYWTLYIANKDTTIGKTKVPKGTVIRATGGGNWDSIDGKINTHIGALLDTPDFDKVQNPTWPMTNDFIKEVEDWARQTNVLIQRDPSKAQAVVNNRTRVINDMKKLLK
jgi:hypothetical protein